MFSYFLLYGENKILPKGAWRQMPPPPLKYATVCVSLWTIPPFRLHSINFRGLPAYTRPQTIVPIEQIEIYRILFLHVSKYGLSFNWTGRSGCFGHLPGYGLRFRARFRIGRCRSDQPAVGQTNATWRVHSDPWKATRTVGRRSDGAKKDGRAELAAATTWNRQRGNAAEKEISGSPTAGIFHGPWITNCLGLYIMRNWPEQRIWIFQSVYK